MKCLAAIFVLVLAACISDVAANASYYPIARMCMAKNNCNENLWTQMRNNESPETKECVCAIGCILKGKGVINADNGIDKHGLKSTLTLFRMSPEKAEVIAEACQTDSGAEECEAAENLFACMKDN